MKQKKFLTPSFLLENGRKEEDFGDNLCLLPQPRGGNINSKILFYEVSQAGCDEFTGTAGPEATAETSQRDRDMPGKEKSWCMSRFICVIFKTRRELYAQCFDELIRQSTINCTERGLLLLRVRDELRMTLHAYQVKGGSQWICLSV